MVERMKRMVLDGSGWINFEPAVDPEAEIPHQGGLFGLFSAQGPAVPLCSWVPTTTRSGRTTVSVGVQHPAGPKVVRHLRELGITIPDGWIVRQDHPRRGLVLELDASEDQQRVLDWLTRVGSLLTAVALTGSWRASLYRSN